MAIKSTQLTTDKGARQVQLMIVQGVANPALAAYGNQVERVANIATQNQAEHEIHTECPREACRFSASSVTPTGPNFGIHPITQFAGVSAKIGSAMIVAGERVARAVVKAATKYDQVECMLGSGKINELRAFFLGSWKGTPGAEQWFDRMVQVGLRVAKKVNGRSRRLGARFIATRAVQDMAQIG